MVRNNWDSLIKPCKFVSSCNSNEAVIVMEPLERGYGITIGNALRRVLLSSIQGTAIIALRIPGVMHEYSTIPGVYEDLVTIILNLKSVVVKMRSDFKRRVVTLKVTGPCVVTAKMINVGYDIEIINGEHVICTLNDGSIDMELMLESGVGYIQPMENHIVDEYSTNKWISISARFNPVCSVAFTVGSCRVGHITDYDKLIMTIITNGAISSDVALGIAARILLEQFTLFSIKDTKNDTQDSSLVVDKQISASFPPALLIRLDELELSVRSSNCLKNEGIVYIGDLVCKTESELLKMQNFGKKSLAEIKNILALYNLKLGMQVSGWPPENVSALHDQYQIGNI